LQELLSIRLEGEAIGEGRIGVPQLLRLLTQLNKVLLRSGQVLRGEVDSLRRGPKEKQLKDLIAFDLVKLAPGSPAVVLGFEHRHQPDTYLPGMDPAVEVLDRAIMGLDQVQQPGQVLPAGYDVGVLMAWRDMGVLFYQGIDKIQFTLNHRPEWKPIAFTRSGYECMEQRIQGPQVNIRTIEGRLLMADFKEHGTRCRIHPSAGEPVLCLFDEEQKEEVLENILHYVKVIGESKEDPFTGKVTSIKIHDIQRLEDREGERADLLPQGVPLPVDFWRSLSLDELAQAQGVSPIQNVRILFGTWPGQDDDRFEDDVQALRQGSPAGGEGS
jgi:hypothetical protein